MAMTDQTGTIKCLAWDLDNTLWDGTLLEDLSVTLRSDAKQVIKTLDARGILHSIASRSNHDSVMQRLNDLGLDAIAFIDDEPFERDEVKFTCPEVTCIDAADLPRVPDMPIMHPRFATEDSRLRRQMVLTDIARKQAEDEYTGPQEAFMESLGMALTIFPAQEEDLQRAEELTVRAHQLNATGVTYSYDELNQFRQSDRYDLLMARLDDRYGSYGHIGLALVEREAGLWTIKLLLMSCRVISRGVGTAMLTHIIDLARKHGVRLQAQFVPNDRNRMMNITFRFAGFREVQKNDGIVALEHDLTDIPKQPRYIT